MKRNLFETVLGALVLGVAAFFLIFSIRTADVGKVDGYKVTANFSGIGGLAIGDDVMISGVKIGNVAGVALDQKTFLAKVSMNIDNDIKIPTDSAALISSQSLLGGRYLAIEPGGEESNLEPGGEIQYTQAPQNLEQLLGQFIFSMQGDKKNEGGQPVSPSAPSPAPLTQDVP